MDTRKKIFFIKASPNGLPMLRSDEEFNKIRQIVERTNLKLSYQIQIILRTTPESVVDVFTEEKPWMIHYSGHSDDDQGEWIIGDQKPFVIDNDDLFALIEDRGHTVKFLFLNSCHSKEMADKFKYIVDFIICFDGKLSDKPAIQFAEKFYSNWSRQATIVEAFNLSMKQTAFLREKYFNPIFYSKINLIMKDLNFLMGNLTDLESAKIELKKQYAISNDIWEKVKGCEESLRALSDDRKSVVMELMVNHPYVTITTWFMEKKEALSRELTDKILFSKSDDDKEDFAADLEILFTRLEDTLISKCHTEPKISKNRIKKVIKNFPSIYFYDALDGINNLVPASYADELPYLNGCTHYIKELMV